MLNELKAKIKSSNIWFKAGDEIMPEVDIFVYAILAAEVNGKTINDWAYPIIGAAEEKEYYSEEEMERFRSRDYTFAEMIENAIKDLVVRLSGFKECVKDAKARRDNKRVTKEIMKSIDYINKAKGCLADVPIDSDIEIKLEGIVNELKTYQSWNVFTKLGFRKGILHPLIWLLCALEQKITHQNFSILVSEIIFNGTGMEIDHSVIYEYLRKVRSGPKSKDDEEIKKMMEEASPQNSSDDLAHVHLMELWKNPHKPVSKVTNEIKRKWNPYQADWSI